MNGKTIRLSELLVSLCFLAFLFSAMVVTVAKYRDELHIPSTTGRKLYE